MNFVNLIRTNADYVKTIAEMKSFNSGGTQPKYFDEGELKVINSQHITETHIDYDNLALTKSSFWETQKESRVLKYDILINTTGANIGRANVFLEDYKALASNHVNILRIRDENPVYVGFVLNSLIGRMQTDKMKTGSAQAEIYPSAFDKFLIPFIQREKQEEIANLYIDSFKLKKKSKQLIETCKRAVEIAIEENEEKAIEFINQLGVENEL